MNSRRLFGLTLAALLLGILPFQALAQGAPRPVAPRAEGGARTIEYPALAGDFNEPNDDASSATWISYNDFHGGLIDPAGDVDYFSFYGYGGDVVVADTDAAEADSPLDTTLTLYDQDGVTQLAFDNDSDADTDSRLSYTLPAEGWYFLKVASAQAGAGGEAYAYWLFLSVADVYEPNNRISRSALIDVGEEVMANVSPAGDVDYYRFYGTAGAELLFDIDAADVGSWLTPDVTLYGIDGFTVLQRYRFTDNSRDPQFIYTLPADGPYYLRIMDEFSDGLGDPQYFYVLRVTHPPLYVSPATNGMVAGVAFAPGDILLQHQGTNEWEMYFDASDVGVKGNLTAFDTLGTCLLLSFATRQTLPVDGFPINVAPHDVVQFCPTHLGDDTSGDFYSFFDGSDVGLSAASEAIDAIDYHPLDSVLYLSTTGNYNLPGFDPGNLTGRDEDVLIFFAHQLGQYTIGGWYLHLAGATVPGLGSEDVSGLSVVSGFERYFLLENGFNVGGVQGDGNDILQVVGDTGGSYTVSAYWRGEDAGFTKRLDGVEVSISPYPIDPYPYP